MDANKFAVRYLFGADAEAVKRERDAAALAAVERAASEKRERDAAALAAVEQEKRDKHSAFIALSRKNKEDVTDAATELKEDVFAFADIAGESPQQRLSPQMKFAKGVHEKGRNEGDVFGGKRRSKSHRKAHRKSHRKAHRKSHRKSHRKAHRKASRKASRKAHRKSCRCD